MLSNEIPTFTRVHCCSLLGRKLLNLPLSRPTPSKGNNISLWFYFQTAQWPIRGLGRQIQHARVRTIEKKKKTDNTTRTTKQTGIKRNWGQKAEMLSLKVAMTTIVVSSWNTDFMFRWKTNFMSYKCWIHAAAQLKTIGQRQRQTDPGD